jgi:redox-sensitive bicupin YhaK (pirin superfamily)
MSLELFDPFLLIDEMGPIEYGPGEAVGAPDHPHRGFETVTYVLEGEAEHEDSAGHRGFIRAGDVQWMTAGRGVVHSEMPSRNMRRDGGRMHGFQIWVNLPSALKMSEPRYQELPASEIPKVRSNDGTTEIAVIAGEALGITAAIDTHTPITYLDIAMAPGGKVELATNPEENSLVYVFGGELLVGREKAKVSDGVLAVLGEGETLELEVDAEAKLPARAIFLGGKPHGEPVARYGPFVMNTPEEIRKAFDDYQAGRMGRIVRR